MLTQLRVTKPNRNQYPNFILLQGEIVLQIERERERAEIFRKTCFLLSGPPSPGIYLMLYLAVDAVKNVFTIFGSVRKIWTFAF